jgi:hypothetical protein
MKYLLPVFGLTLLLDELMTLQPFVIDPAKNGGLETEDCVLCG